MAYFSLGDTVQIHEWNCEIQDPLRVSPSAKSELYACRTDSLSYPLFLKYFHVKGSAASELAQRAFAVWQHVRERLVSAGFSDILWCDDRFQLSQFVEGKNVENLHVGMDGLSIPQIHATVLHTADKVDHLIQQGVVHGDIKPENTMATLECPDAIPPDVRLIDFDLMDYPDRRLFMSSTHIMGSPTFMPPEQIHGRYASTTDVFALGMTTLDLLSSRKNNLNYTDVVRDADLSDFIHYRVSGNWLRHDAKSQLEKALLHRDDIDVRQARQLMNFFFMATRNDPDARPKSGEEMRQILTDTGNLLEI